MNEGILRFFTTIKEIKMINFYLAESKEDYAAAKLLFQEYAESININLDFQRFDEELDNLNSMYGAPQGGILLAKDAEAIVACVAVRKISETIGELKRMYTRPAWQNKGIGKILLERAVVLARDCNYKALRLDSLNYMTAAIRLYKQAGFDEIPAYYKNPVAEAIYFEKIL